MYKKYAARNRALNTYHNSLVVGKTKSFSVFENEHQTNVMALYDSLTRRKYQQ